MKQQAVVLAAGMAGLLAGPHLAHAALDLVLLCVLLHREGLQLGGEEQQLLVALQMEGGDEGVRGRQCDQLAGQ